VANLLIEIGNTALKAAWTEDVTLGKTFRYQGEKVLDFILSITGREKPDVMAVASVKQLSGEEIEILERECRHLLIMDSAHREWLKEYDLPSYLSYDRAASIIAVRYMFKGKSCTIFDFGTTLTVDFLGENGKYCGGNISLGCRTRFKALQRYSKTLPLINTPNEIGEMGDSIVTSIENGVISGIKFEIEGYVHSHRENVIVFTGGDAAYFAAVMGNPVFVVPNLGLIGLAQITFDYVKKNQ